MGASERQPLQVGDVVGDYEVVETDSFGPLPRAVIRPGCPNAGIVVILTTRWRDGRR